MRTKKILLLMFIVFILGYTGSWWGGSWYDQTGNSYFHFVGGLLTALLVASYYASEFSKLSQLPRFFCILGLVIGVGVFWEFHEYALTHFLNIPLQGDLDDTMKDLLLDTIGGIVGALIMRKS